MRRAMLLISTCAMLLAIAALPSMASAASSSIKIEPQWTHLAAISTAYKYAINNFSYVVPEESRTKCSETGVNESGKTQWVCYGPLYSESCYREWQVNIGPYGSVLYSDGKVGYIC